MCTGRLISVLHVSLCRGADGATGVATGFGVGAGQRPQLKLQKPCMKATPHLPKPFCWAQVNWLSGGISGHVAAAAGGTRDSSVTSSGASVRALPAL